MSVEELPFEALVLYIPYSDLIALAGTCRTVRRKIRKTAKWKNLLIEWKRDAMSYPVIRKTVYGNWRRVPLRLPPIEGLSVFVQDWELNAGRFSLSQVHMLCATARASQMRPADPAVLFGAD